jgi:hypothetical protein
MKLRPASSSDLKGYALWSAFGALWCLFDLCHVLRWIRLHVNYSSIDPQILRESLDISNLYGPDLSKVPISVILFHFILRFLFWTGTGVVFYTYSFRISKIRNGFRIIGLLFVGTIFLDVLATFILTGRGRLFLVDSFGTVGAALGTCFVLAIIFILLFPRDRK